MALEHPDEVIRSLKIASSYLSQAHGEAGEAENDQTNLTGPVRDAIFGLNTAVEALVALIEPALIDGTDDPNHPLHTCPTDDHADCLALQHNDGDPHG